MPDIKQLMRDYNTSGTAELWLDTEHVVPYWIDILSLGFPGLLKRDMENGTFTKDQIKSFLAYFML